MLLKLLKFTLKVNAIRYFKQPPSCLSEMFKKVLKIWTTLITLQYHKRKICFFSDITLGQQDFNFYNAMKPDKIGLAELQFLFS